MLFFVLKIILIKLHVWPLLLKVNRNDLFSDRKGPRKVYFFAKPSLQWLISGWPLQICRWLIAKSGPWRILVGITEAAPGHNLSFSFKFTQINPLLLSIVLLAFSW